LVEQAAAVRRVLAEARPDAFLPDLAASLNSQSVFLSNLGRTAEALTAIEETVTAYGILAGTWLTVLDGSYATIQSAILSARARYQARAIRKEAAAIPSRRMSKRWSAERSAGRNGCRRPASWPQRRP
jgi:hypothetical protein